MGSPDLAWVSRELAAGKLRPAELAEALWLLSARHSSAEMARALRLSVSHVRNLVRLRRQLLPEAWERVRAEPGRLRLDRWLRVAALSPAEQRSVLRGDRSAGRRPSVRVIERMLGQLAPADVRARVLAWALGQGRFPSCARL